MNQTIQRTTRALRRHVLKIILDGFEGTNSVLGSSSNQKNWTHCIQSFSSALSILSVTVFVSILLSRVRLCRVHSSFIRVCFGLSVSLSCIVEA